MDTVAGMRLTVKQGVVVRWPGAGPGRQVRCRPVYDGGTPTRTGTVGASCVGTTYPGALASSSGLYPNQILEAYGIASLHSAGLLGQDARLAIGGEAPTRPRT